MSCSLSLTAPLDGRDHARLAPPGTPGLQRHHQKLLRLTAAADSQLSSARVGQNRLSSANATNKEAQVGGVRLDMKISVRSQHPEIRATCGG